MNANRPWACAWAGVCLSVVFVGAKALLLGKPDSWEWIRNLALASCRDVIFALSFGLLGSAVMYATARWPRIARVLFVLFLAFGAGCAFFSVVSVGVFEYFGRPLTYDLLRLAANIAALKSSITDRLTPTILAAIVGTPALWLAATWWCARHRRAVLAGIGVTAVWLGIGTLALATADPGVRNRHIGLCPQWEFLRTAAIALSGFSTRAIAQDFPVAYLEEFRPASERQAVEKKFEPPAGAARPRNVIVVVLESVGTRYLSLYGSPYLTTPCLAAEAQHALVFDNFYSHLGYTFCSNIAINYSIHPGLPWYYVPRQGSRPLPTTLASVLRAQGWSTAYLHNGDLDWDGLRTVIEGRGFDIAQDKRDLPCPPVTSWGTEDRCLFDRLIQFIDEQKGRPFFTVCWTDQTHDPYAESPDAEKVDFFRGKPPSSRAEELGRYLNILHETDRHLGRLFATLRERGLADDTLVVVTGDHGEAFTDPHDQRGHGFTLYQEDVNVPLMLWNPRLFPSGGRVATIGSHMDINATIADILGVPAPAGSQGYSLFDPRHPPRAYFVASIGDIFIGVREDSWKYILEASSGRELLFDLSNDPRELRDVSAREQERLRSLRQRVAAFTTFENDFLRAPPN